MASMNNTHLLVIEVSPKGRRQEGISEYLPSEMLEVFTKAQRMVLETTGKVTVQGRFATLTYIDMVRAAREKL